MSIIDQVRKKIDQYGLEVYDDHKASKGHYVFYVEDMILFVDIKKAVVGVSFQVSARPDKVANFTLILNEIGYPIDVMEPFIFNDNNECITGEAAFEISDRFRKNQVIQGFMKKQAYAELLMSEECFEC